MSDDSPMIRVLGNLLSRVREAIDRAIGELKKISEIIKEGFTKVIDAIHENIQAQAELQILSKMADVQSYETMIKAREIQIHEELEELDEKLKAIEERYNKVHAELDVEAQERIRELGHHIFEIMEDQFEKQVEQPLLRHVSDAWASLLAENDWISFDRMSRLEEVFKRTKENAEHILSSQKDLSEKLEGYIYSHKLENAIPVHIPFWIIHTQQDGKINREIITPSWMKREGYIPHLEPIDGFDEFMNPLAEEDSPLEATTICPDDIEFKQFDKDMSGFKLINYNKILKDIVKKNKILVRMES
jgi:hypothetical protein